MNNLEIINMSIDSNKDLNHVQKNIIKGQTARAYEEINNKNSLYSEIRDLMYKSCQYIISEIYELDEFYVIFRAVNNKDNEDYYWTYSRENKKLISEVSNTRHMQILVTLGHHYEGGNTRFASYAGNMLGI